MNERPDPLATLKASRSAAQARATRLNEALVKLEGLKGAVTKAEVDLREFDEDAAEALQRWALEGGEGDPTVADPLSRQALQRAVARALVAVSQAGDAASSLTGELQKANRDVASLSTQIEAQAFDMLEAEHAEAVAVYHEIIQAKALPALCRAASLCRLIIAKADALNASGLVDQARAHYGRAERLRQKLAGLPGTVDALVVTRGEVEADAEFWKGRLAALTGDPVKPAPVFDVAAHKASLDEQAAAHARAMLEGFPTGPNVVPNGHAFTHQGPAL